MRGNVMKRILSICIIAMMLMALVPACFATPASAAEDNTPPELKSIKIVQTSVKAGSNIKVTIKVKEDQTGLSNAFIQLNHVKTDAMVHKDTIWSKPVYSSGSSYITYTFSIPTEKTTRSGEWFVGYLELTDKKGNYCRYYGNRESGNNKLTSEFVYPEQVVEGVTRMNIYGTVGDVNDPIINWIKVTNPTVEKPGTLIIQANITDESGIFSPQINLLNESRSDRIILDNFDTPAYKGTKTYTFKIPISEKRHNGIWHLETIFLTDRAGNMDIYSANTNKGTFESSNNKYVKMSLPKFKIIGVAGDETAPTVESIEVLNKDGKVQKPGILELKLYLTEEDSGITNIEVELECTSSDALDIKSRIIYGVCVKGYEKNEGTLEETVLDKPLMTGEYVIKVPIPSYCQNGSYSIHVRELRDKADNLYADYGNKWLVGEFDVEDEFDYAFEMGITNRNLLSTIETMEEGEVGRILLGDSKAENVLTKKMLDAIAGCDKTLVCYKSGYQWIINGYDVEPEFTKNLNLTTRIYNISKYNLSSGQSAVCLSFENNGQLPGAIQFRFKSAFVKDFYNKEDELYMYHVDGEESTCETDIDYLNDDYIEIPQEESNLEVVVDGSDSWCYVDLSHNSKYVVSAEKLQKLTMKNATVSGFNSAYTYNGKVRKPTFKVKVAGKTLKANRDYTVVFKGNKNVGTATATIAGKGNYKVLGSKKVSFKINPKGTSISKLSKGNDSFKVKWKKQKSKMSTSRITGYQVRYSTSSKMAKPNAVTIKGYTKTSKTIKKLKNKKTYYIQVRTYKTVKGVKYYSSWSKAKKVKTK